MRRECAGAHPNTCLGNRRIGDRHGHTLIFRQIRSSDRRRGNRSHRTGLLDLAPNRFLSARHFVHTTVIYHLGKSFIKGYAHLVSLGQTEFRRFHLTTVERDAVTGLRRILGSENQIVESVVAAGHVVHHHSVQIAVCIGIHRSRRSGHLRDQLGNGNGRSLTRIGRNHTAFEIDLLTAVALDELYVIDCEYRRQISRETDRKLADSLLEREIYGELHPVRIGRIAAADLLVSQVARPVGSVTYGNVERLGFENVVVSTAVTLRISTAEDDPVVGLARRHRNSVDVESRRCRTEENLVRTRSTVVTAAELTGSTHRYVRRGIGHRRITRTGSILPCIGLIEERPFIIDLLGRRLVEIVLVNRIAARIGRHDTAAEIDFLTAVAIGKRKIVNRKCGIGSLTARRGSKANRKLLQRRFQRKVRFELNPVRIGFVAAADLLIFQLFPGRTVSDPNVEILGFESIIVSTIIIFRIIRTESNPIIGFARRQRNVIYVEISGSRTEEDLVLARSSVIAAAVFLRRAYRHILVSISYGLDTRARSILPSIRLIEERPFIIDLLGRRLVEIVLVNRIAARIGRHDTAAEIDFLTAVAIGKRKIVNRKCGIGSLTARRGSKANRKLLQRRFQRKVRFELNPVRIGFVAAADLLIFQLFPGRTVSDPNVEILGFESIIVSTIIIFRIIRTESNPIIGFARRQRNVIYVEISGSRTEEDLVLARSSVIAAAVFLRRAYRHILVSISYGLDTRARSILPSIRLIEERPAIVLFRSKRFIEIIAVNNGRRLHFALKYIDILLNQCAVGVVNLESHFGRLTDVRSGHRNGHGSIALAFGSRKAHPSLFVLDDSTPGTVRFNDKSTVVLICGLSLRIERQVLRRDVQIGSAHVVIVVGTSREHRHGEHGQCTEEQFPNATLFHKQLNFRVI